MTYIGGAPFTSRNTVINAFTSNKVRELIPEVWEPIQKTHP